MPEVCSAQAPGDRFKEPNDSLACARTPLASSWFRWSVLNSGQKVSFFIAGCYFTKELVVSALRNTTAFTVLDKMDRLVVAAKSTPELIISDQEAQIVGKDFEAYCMSRGIQHNTSSAYHQQGNGFIERMVRTLKPLLFIKLYKDKMRFKDALHFACHALNKSMVNSSTGFTSHQLTTGSDYNTPFDNRLRKFIARQELVQLIGKENSKVAKQTQKLAYDAGKVSRLPVEIWCGC
jgi:transposase InsO family protein